MNFKKITFKSNFLTLSLASLVFAASCGGDKTKEEQANNENVLDVDTAKTAVLNVGGQLFSIPSPIQTAMLIQKSGLAYNKEILNISKNSDSYTSEYNKALNLGIYGADLGYVSMYNQTQDAIGYLAAVKKLADKLGVSAAFDANIMKRIETNIANKDSMLMLVGVAYRASDAYLKTNQRTEISSLILTGGWIESMHFSLTSYTKKPSEEIKYRIAEQKQALESIIKLLNSHNMPDANKLSSQLTDLLKIYEGIQFKYTFVAPVTDSIKKMTYINSTNEVTITPEQLSAIEAKIQEIRNNIINVTA